MKNKSVTTARTSARKTNTKSNSTSEKWEVITEFYGLRSQLELSSKGQVRRIRKGSVIETVSVAESLAMYHNLFAESSADGWSNGIGFAKWLQLVAQNTRTLEAKSSSDNSKTYSEVLSVGNNENAKALVISECGKTYRKTGVDESAPLFPVSIKESFRLASQWLADSDAAAAMGANININFTEAGLSEWFDKAAKALADK